MKQLLPLIAIFTTMEMQAQIQYPVTKKKTVTDDYFGTKVEDPIAGWKMTMPKLPKNGW